MADAKKIRNFSGVLYPDSESYNCDEVISRIKSKFKQWAFCLHDMDVNDERILRLTLDDFPIILIDRDMANVNIPCVASDNYKAAKVQKKYESEDIN